MLDKIGRKLSLYWKWSISFCQLVPLYFVKQSFTSDGRVFFPIIVWPCLLKLNDSPLLENLIDVCGSGWWRSEMKAQPQKCICPNFFKSHILFRLCRLNMRMMMRRMLFFSGGGKIKKVQRWGEEGAGWLDWEQKSILPSSNVGNDHYGDCAIAVTVVINVSAGAGRVKLIYYCGEIGICLPVQRGTHLPQGALNLKSCKLPIFLQEPLKHL